MPALPVNHRSIAHSPVYTTKSVEENPLHSRGVYGGACLKTYDLTPMSLNDRPGRRPHPAQPGPAQRSTARCVLTPTCTRHFFFFFARAASVSHTRKQAKCRQSLGNSRCISTIAHPSGKTEGFVSPQMLSRMQETRFIGVTKG